MCFIKKGSHKTHANGGFSLRNAFSRFLRFFTVCFMVFMLNGFFCRRKIPTNEHVELWKRRRASEEVTKKIIK